MLSNCTFSFVVDRIMSPTSVVSPQQSLSQRHYLHPVPKAKYPELYVCTSKESSPIDSASKAEKGQNSYAFMGKHGVKVYCSSGSVQLTCSAVVGDLLCSGGRLQSQLMTYRYGILKSLRWFQSISFSRMMKRQR